jgi:hypothetical protein
MFMYLFKHHAEKSYKGMGAELHTFLTSEPEYAPSADL